MNSKTIEKIIVKYLIQEANTDELDALSKWIQIPENQTSFEKYVKTHYKITLSMSNPDVNEIRKNLLQQIRKDQSLMSKLKIRKRVIEYAAAAVLVGVLATTYIFRDILFNSPIDITPVTGNTNIIEPGTDKAVLTLEDGSTVLLEKESNQYLNNAKSNGKQIIYAATTQNSTKTDYNYLTTPRGGEYHIKLSDGTKVWLNSESQIKYPVSFKEGEARQVELIYGEAYFDVSPSKDNKGAKFKVFNRSQEIEVLGTEFNIKAYKDETSIYTTLVEGKVAVSFDGDKKQNLTPNQQSIWNPNTKQFSVDTVNVYNEISWKYGVFSFDGKPLNEIVKILSRWYDVDFVILDKTIEEIEFVGVLRKNKKLEDIILNIKNFGIIKDYKINNKTVILK